MKVIEIITILLLFCLSCVLAIFLLGMLGRVMAVADHAAAIEKQVEQREELLHDYMFPEPIVVHVSGEVPYVDDGLVYYIARPGE